MTWKMGMDIKVHKPTTVHVFQVPKTWWKKTSVKHWKV